jgi:Na+/proline symporter
VKTGSLLAFIIFILVALAHLLRLIYSSEIIVDGYVVPQWVSVVGLIVPAFVAYLLWKEGRPSQ